MKQVAIINRFSISSKSSLFIILNVLIVRAQQHAQSSKSNGNINLLLKESSLDNQHLIVAAIEVPMDYVLIRNETGHIVHSEGNICTMFDWLSAAHPNSSFSLVPINTKIQPVDSSPDQPGVTELLSEGNYDIMTAAVPTSSRIRLVDYTQPILYLPVSFLIPIPVSFADILSATKPFENWVWAAILIGICAIIISLKLLSALRSNGIGQTSSNSKEFSVNTIFNVFGLLLHQAVGYGFSQRLTIRIVIASWSLTALVLINSYNSLLTSFITAPNPKPLIKSIYELRDRPDIRLVTDKYRNAEAVLLSAESGFFKILGDRLRADPQSRCLNSSQCVKFAKEGHAVYPAARDGVLLNALKNDYEATGKCNLEVGEESFMELQVSWAVQKKSRYTDTLNKSFMRMREAGLLKKWAKNNTPKVKECYGAKKKDDQKVIEGRAPLSLNGLSTAFLVLSAGATISFISFVVEILKSKVGNLYL